MEAVPFFIRRGEPLVEPPVPSPMLGQIVIVFPGVPEHVAVSVPLVGGVPPGPMLMLPKLIFVMEKLQTCALAGAYWNRKANMIANSKLAGILFTRM